MAIVHITPDRGLCGGLVTNINRKTNSFIHDENIPVSLICVGRKGIDFMRRTGRDVLAEFTGLGDRPRYLDTLPISKIIIDDYTNGVFDAVYIAYTRFVSVLVQRPVVEPILPAQPEESVKGHEIEFLYEPDAETVLGGLLPRFVEMQVYHAILEAIASEQCARMIAMRNATDNAGELIDDLTLMYNKARQESITKELLDITGGVEALNR
jgi:F-type H+-transporting ATPase subunit gamma